jgi:H+/Cl- antiporter ClcA
MSTPYSAAPAAAAVTAAAAVLAVTADLPLVPTILVLERRLQTLMP